MANEKLYIPPAVTVDVAIFTVEEDQLKLLLIQRAKEPFQGSWALPGGFLHTGEETEQAAKRILQEKAGVNDVYVEQLYTFNAPKRDPRGHVLSVTYFALVPRARIVFAASRGVQAPSLLPVQKLPKLPFDHDEIVAYALKRVRAKLEYTNTIFSLLPERFTLNQLQRTYEIILNRTMDKRNFQKKFFTLDLIRPTKQMVTGLRQRPARLYEFKKRIPIELKRFF